MEDFLRERTRVAPVFLLLLCSEQAPDSLVDRENLRNSAASTLRLQAMRWRLGTRFRRVRSFHVSWQKLYQPFIGEMYRKRRNDGVVCLR